MTDPPLPFAPPPAAAEPPSPLELAAHLAAKLCHDFISPTSALVSGLDLLEDPASQDMREDAMGLIAESGRKLEAYLTFYRTAFGGSAATEIFDSRELEKLAQGRYAFARAELDWAVAPTGLDKAPARSLLNLSDIGIGALPMGGVARLTAEPTHSGLEVALRAESPRARLHEDVARGLKGEPLGEGLGGRWVQAYFLSALVGRAGGSISLSQQEGLVTVTVTLPA